MCTYAWVGTFQCIDGGAPFYLAASLCFSLSTVRMKCCLPGGDTFSDF